MKKPNFFVIGAPKCGTTSLYHWLKQHPYAFLPGLKEPHFFNTDDKAPDRCSLAAYENLFEDAGDADIAVGECSVWYLASKEAVPRVLDYNPDARFIVCLRNPIEMAYALHHQQLFAANEHIVSFRAAWQAQDLRARMKDEPAATSTHLLYGPMCKLGEQVERLKSHASDDRIHIMFLDDMKEDPSAAYRGILEFLGLPDFQPEFRKSNEARARRLPFIRRIVRGLGSVRRSLGVRRGFGILSRLDRWNSKPGRWRPDEGMNETLCSYFRDDIRLLGRMTGRDLTHWLR